MTCDGMLERMSAALDGELTADEKAQLDRHLAQCDNCRALFDDLSAICGACVDMEVMPPPELRAQILEHLPPQKHPAKVITIHWKRWAAMAATFVLVALAAWHLPETRNKPASLQPTSVEGSSPGSADTSLPKDSPSELAPDEAMDPANAIAQTPMPENDMDIAPPQKEQEPDASVSAAGGMEAAAFGGPANDSTTATAGAVMEDQLTTENGVMAVAAAPEVSYAAEETTPMLFSTARSMAKLAAEDGVTENDIMPRDAGAYSGVTALSDSVADGDSLSLQSVKNELVEMPEPHPEIANDENVTADFGIDQVEYEPLSRQYCGVLTFEGSTALIDYQPDMMSDDATACYELSKAAFDALIKELEAGSIKFDLRTTGDDISASAETGFVRILSPN